MKYKNYLLGTISVIVIFLGGYWFLKEKYFSYALEHIEIKTTYTDIGFSDEALYKGNYDYYQVYIYPSQYHISCKYENQPDWCEGVMKGEEKLKNYIVGYYTKDMTVLASGEVSLRLFKNYEETQKISKEMIALLASPSQNKNTPGEEEKYFENRKSDNGDTLPLNDYERSCLEKIKMDIPEGSFNAQETIKERVKNECSVFSQVSPEIIPVDTNKKESKIEFGFELDELKIVYKFFDKEKGIFQEKYQKSQVIPFKKKFKTTFSSTQL